MAAILKRIEAYFFFQGDQDSITRTVRRLAMSLFVLSILVLYEVEMSNIVAAQVQPDACASASGCPPWQTVRFADYAAPDDAVALDGLLEAAGYDWSHNLWADVAAGNFCRRGEQELVVVQNQSPYFSILRGPTPFVGATADLASNPAHTWRAVAAGNFDPDGYQEIVAVRNVTTSSEPDLFIIDVAEDCTLRVAATHIIGSVSNADWVDVAVGNFDGVGYQEIALVQNQVAYFVFLRFFDGVWGEPWSANLGSRSQYPWQALAAGNLDSILGDELIAVRAVTDGVGETVRAYRWDAATSNFSLFATSTFANTGNHTWISAAAGNFGGDARAAIALVKDKHSHFIVLDYPPDAGATLRVLTATDLDTAPGQSWRSLAATDWLDADQGYAELIAVRNLLPNPDTPDKMYQTDFFVYGNLFHRAARQHALSNTEAVLAGNEVMVSREPEIWDFRSVEQIKTWLAAIHANTYNVELRLPSEYEFLVEFLEATRDFCIDGRPLRVWITLPGPSLVAKGYRAIPSDSFITDDIAELDYFTSDDPDYNPALDYLAWAALISRLAQRYPHIVAVSIDDFLSNHNRGTFSPGYVAELQSRLRWPSEWLNFVPTVYYEYFENGQRYPDLPLMLDSLLFYFVNYKHGISEKEKPVPEETVLNLPEEITDMVALLPADRSLQFGAYLSPAFHGIPSIQLGWNLLNTALAQQRVAGTTVYTGSVLWGNNNPPPAHCETALDHRFCVVQSVYGSQSAAPVDRFSCAATYLPVAQR